MSIDTVWTVFLAGCAALITISTAIKVIVSAIQTVRKPTIQQDHRLDDIDEKLKEHDELLVDEGTRLELLNTGSATTQKALLALLSHAIDGNNVYELKAARKELQDFLIER